MRDSDATLIVQPAAQGPADPGTAFALACARRYDRPTLSCDPGGSESAERIAIWIRSLGIEALNVAGPSEATCPGVGDATCALLGEVFGRCVGS